jgi:hypothetical protein
MAENQFQAASTAEEVSHVSSINEVECNRFWNAMTEEISELLWLPIEKGSVSKSVKTLMSNSWFSVFMFVQTSNLQMDSSLSCFSVSTFRSLCLESWIQHQRILGNVYTISLSELSIVSEYHGLNSVFIIKVVEASLATLLCSKHFQQQCLRYRSRNKSGKHALQASENI